MYTMIADAHRIIRESAAFRGWARRICRAKLHTADKVGLRAMD